MNQDNSKSVYDQPQTTLQLQSKLSLCERAMSMRPILKNSRTRKRESWLPQQLGSRLCPVPFWLKLWKIWCRALQVHNLNYSKRFCKGMPRHLYSSNNNCWVTCNTMVSVTKTAAISSTMMDWLRWLMISWRTSQAPKQDLVESLKFLQTIWLF